MSGVNECDECNENLIFDYKHDEYVCDDCGLIHIYDKEYGPEGFVKWTDEVENKETIHSYEFRRATRENCHIDDGIYYGILKDFARSFPGENALIMIESGESQNTHRNKDSIRHYCDESSKSYIARPIWWINPKNTRDRRWYCMACVKERYPEEFPAKWKRDDRMTLRKLKRTGGSERIIMERIIDRYLSKREGKLRIRNPSGSSEFHYQGYHDEYQKTAILTAQHAMMNGHGYVIKRKGGRKANLGAKSITKWCNLNFVDRYNVNTVRKILNGIKIDDGQRYKISTSNIVREKSLLTPLTG